MPSPANNLYCSNLIFFVCPEGTNYKDIQKGELEERRTRHQVAGVFCRRSQPAGSDCPVANRTSGGECSGGVCGMDAAAEAYRDVFTASPEQSPPEVLFATGQSEPASCERRQNAPATTMLDNLLISHSLSFLSKS